MSAPDEVDQLVARDHGRLLWNLALAGAQVRRAQQVAVVGGDRAVGHDGSGHEGLGREGFGQEGFGQEGFGQEGFGQEGFGQEGFGQEGFGQEGFGQWDPDRLDLGGPPRALVIATDEPTSGVADLLAVLAPPVAPVTVLRSPQLPRWVGAADAAVVVSLDGRHPRLVALAEQAQRRGCALLVVAPLNSPVAAAAGRGVVVDLPSDTARRAACWSALGPVLIAAGRWRLTDVGPRLLEDVAAALDEVSHRCRPSSDVVANPARALAEEFAEALPVVVGVGPLAAVAADRFALALRLLAGTPALAVHLPDDLAQATALLTPAGDAAGAGQDFFRDRVEEAPVLPRFLLVGSEGSPDDPDLGVHDGGVENAAAEQEAFGAARVVVRAAEVAGTRAITLDVPTGDPLVRWAAAVHLGLFTGAYLALLRDLDPSAPRPGETS